MMEQENSGCDQGWEPHGSMIGIPELIWNL